MNTSTHALELLQQALKPTREAQQVIGDLIAPHDFEDVALLITQAANALLESASHFMKNEDEAAFTAMEKADDFLDEVYSIIEADLSDEE